MIRRLLAEERALVASSRSFAAELPDATGRARATGELDAVDRELDRIDASLDGADGDRLDAAAAKLSELETRAALVHSALRTATRRTTAVEIDAAR